ncbi:5-amino-6-(D-ribitylamino)uracil--L-tyrosine 4-hydroxyphenyl transferase CofH [Aquibium sp. A9E412]|uniref:5-amino-6-(D-ribitylamino)uracil--L-tyrosine 4-hydroxyphenyl transferase CofH n=1 Tax=Aquibium sp. A9E412 TaxID=2976767 RepID=UPI0025B2327C|nr:5-amino-6-(D-ribitylamino)uracil--L-tyrosine 4-hydroxyphenyl transferase CofH [Aquibium sp. A9E412]MDN2567113.1 5-amino-6-(D-ribitylamino)uracil--L-tyrosine 4-hydroxyphenyl transferase CofH [Aquibium sp. A9E412]
MSIPPIAPWTDRLINGGSLTDEEALLLAGCDDLPALTRAAGTVRDARAGDRVTVSRKVFIPLTQLCRDVCHYCTFAQAPRNCREAFLKPDAVLEIARRGVAAGCDEALFTLGDKPELRYAVAREELKALGHATTADYLQAMAGMVLRETGLLPHINAGVMSEAEIRDLRAVSVSQGIMLETAAERLSQRGGPHFGSPDKQPAVRLAMIEAAGRAAVPFTSGILIGIGETRRERIEALLALRALHRRHGHIQEIIVQNFRAKPGTRMADAAEPGLADQVWTIAVARLIFGRETAIQSPPNLRAQDLGALIGAGIDDWGGVSPVTPDHVNPEAPWPELQRLADETANAGRTLVPRLAVYPDWLADAARWLAPEPRMAALRRQDGSGHAHESGWRVGREQHAHPFPQAAAVAGPQAAIGRTIDRAAAGRALSEGEITALFEARGSAREAVVAAADAVRRERVGDTVGYVVTRNINYTNVCGYGCRFCAFSKGRTAEHLRGRPYDLELSEIARRVDEAWQRGGVEVCMQGGIHPDYTGETYLEICRTAKRAVPDIHVHAFSPLEVRHGADTLGLPVADFLQRLKEAGLGSLPGTAAEILDDEIRATLCAEKLSTAAWFEVVEAAHRAGLRTTATIMFGHVEGYAHWARHLTRIRAAQERTGGFTEFVPLPFVHMEAPIYLKGEARQGPSFREAVLMHAVARLALNPVIPNIQVSWVKMGEAGIAAALAAGANDLGGVLMDESISRAAGTEHGQEYAPQRMEAAIRRAGRIPRQRTTLYGTPPAVQTRRSHQAPPLAERIQAPALKRARTGSRHALAETATG